MQCGHPKVGCFFHQAFRCGTPWVSGYVRLRQAMSGFKGFGERGCKFGEIHRTLQAIDPGCGESGPDEVGEVVDEGGAWLGVVRCPAIGSCEDPPQHHIGQVFGGTRIGSGCAQHRLNHHGDRRAGFIEQCLRTVGGQDEAVDGRVALDRPHEDLDPASHDLLCVNWATDPLCKPPHQPDSEPVE